MSQQMRKFFTFINCVFGSLALLLPFVGTSYSPEQPDNVLLYATVVADLHVDGDPMRDRNNKLRRALAGISKASPKLDALVFAGDITNSAAVVEYTNLNRMMLLYNRTKTIIPAMGNHDARGTSIYPDFDEACVLFREFCAKVGIETEQNYYALSVNGYRFIVLGTEALLQNEAYISDTQLSWLDGELNRASDDGKPVFIICHQPLKGTVPNSETDGHIGEQSDAVKAVIDKYTGAGMTVVLFSGHRHVGLSPQTLTQNGSLWCVDLPTLLYSDGDGMTMEVYSEKIVLRAINFISGERREDCRFEIPLE